MNASRAERMTPRTVASLILACLLISVHCSSFGGVLDDVTRFLGGKVSEEVATKVAVLHIEDRNWLVAGLDFSPDGTRIAVVADTRKVDIWDWRNQRVERTLEKARPSIQGAGEPTLQYSPDGRYLALCDDDATAAAQIWDAQSWAVAKDIEHRGGCNVIRFTPDSRSLLFGSLSVARDDSNLYCYSTGSWDLLWSLRNEGFYPTALAVSPAGDVIAVGGEVAVWAPPPQVSILRFESDIAVWDLRQRKVVKRLRLDAMGSMDWSPDGKRLAVAGRLYVEIFDMQSGRRLVHQKIDGSAALKVRFTPDGRYLIVGDSNGQGSALGVWIWDSQMRHLLQKIGGDVGSISVSRDGRYFAVGDSVERSITVWQFK